MSGDAHNMTIVDQGTGANAAVCSCGWQSGIASSSIEALCALFAAHVQQAAPCWKDVPPQHAISQEQLSVRDVERRWRNLVSERNLALVECLEAIGHYNKDKHGDQKFMSDVRVAELFQMVGR